MADTFDTYINDSNLSAVVDMSYPGRPLFVAFSGIGGGLGVHPFEFFNISKPFNVNKIFFRDFTKSWYHSGVPGISSTISETASFLKSEIRNAGVSKVAVFGSSMGGYAALLFGILIHADVVHAFGPHTFIHDINFIRCKDPIARVHSTYCDTFFDIRKILESEDYRGTLHIYYDTNDGIDKKHAQHVEGLKNIEIHPFTVGGHSLVKLLKETGDLQKIIQASVCIDQIESMAKSVLHPRYILRRIACRVKHLSGREYSRISVKGSSAAERKKTRP